MAFGAANRDPKVFDRPDDLILGRPRTREPLTWGHGAHYCIGSLLAKMQLRIAITAIPRSYPTLRLAGEVFEIPNHLLRISAAIPTAR